MSIDASGMHEIIVTATGYNTFDAKKNISCGDTLNIELVPSSYNPAIQFNIKGCCDGALGLTAYLPGAAISLLPPSGYEFDCTTNSTGQCNFFVAEAGTYSYMISKSRFQTITGTVTITNCLNTTTTINYTMDPASGYVCGEDSCSGGVEAIIPDPIPTTLNLTDSVYGPTTLTWDPVNLWWLGTIVTTSMALCNCPAGLTFTLTYTLYRCHGTPSGRPLGITWLSGSEECGGFFTGTDLCPTDSTVTLPSGCKIIQNSSGDIIFTCGGVSFPMTVSTTIPYDFSGTIPAPAACVANATNQLQTVYPSGATITITE